MLNIYIGRESLPKDKQFVFDADAFILSGLDLRNDAFTVEVLREVEQGEYLSADRFTDRFGLPLHISCLSTSSKILLCAYYTDAIINSTEIGFNALSILLRMPNGNVYFDNDFDELEPMSLPFSVNGVVYNKTEDFINLGDNYHARVYI